MLQSIMGYGYPPWCLPHGILGNVAKHYGIWVPPLPQRLSHGILGNVAKHYGIWAPPPPMDRQTDTYAGGKNICNQFGLTMDAAIYKLKYLNLLYILPERFRYELYIIETNSAIFFINSCLTNLRQHC